MLARRAIVVGTFRTGTVSAMHPAKREDSMDLDNSLPFLGETFGSLILVGGILAGIGVMRLAGKHYGRICQRHGSGVATCGLTGELSAQRLLAVCGLSEVVVRRLGRRNFYHPRT